jgi:hypothetical protein
MEEG